MPAKGCAKVEVALEVNISWILTTLYGVVLLYCNWHVINTTIKNIQMQFGLFFSETRLTELNPVNKATS